MRRFPYRLGVLTWPETQVGYRVHIPCPWGSPISSYKGVYRTCELYDNETVWEIGVKGATHCDDPPTSRYLRAIGWKRVRIKLEGQINFWYMSHK